MDLRWRKIKKRVAYTHCGETYALYVGKARVGFVSHNWALGGHQWWAHLNEEMMIPAGSGSEQTNADARDALEGYVRDSLDLPDRQRVRRGRRLKDTCPSCGR